MIDLLIATALAEATASGTTLRTASIEGPEISAGSDIRVEAPRRTRIWTMPDLDYGDARQCASWWEGKLPGFGTVKIGPRCADGASDASFD